jgi:hypothetical protein
MTDSPDTFSSLWDYCTSNQRVVPKDWQKLYDMLADKRQLPSGGWLPALPLILAARHTTMPIEKQQRFKEHILWARNHDQLDQIGNYLRSLPEQEWFHFREL